MKSNRIFAVFLLIISTIFLSLQFFGFQHFGIIDQLNNDITNVNTIKYATIVSQYTNYLIILLIPIALLSDYIQKRYEVLISGIILSGFGFILLSLQNINFFTILLSALGTASIIANFPSLLASLFDKNEEKRNLGFILFFLALTIGQYTSSFSFEKIFEKSSIELGFTVLYVLLLIVLLLLGFSRKVIKNNIKTLQKNESKPNTIFIFLTILLLVVSEIMQLSMMDITQIKLDTYDVFTLGQAKFDPQIFTGFTGTFSLFFLITLFFVYMVKKSGYNTKNIISISFALLSISSLIILPIAFEYEFDKVSFFFMFLGNMFFIALVSSLLIPFSLGLMGKLTNQKYLSTTFSVLVFLYLLVYQYSDFWKMKSSEITVLFVIGISFLLSILIVKLKLPK